MSATVHADPTVSTGAGWLNDAPVTPEVARFLYGCLQLGMAYLGGDVNVMRRCMDHLDGASLDVECAIDAPLGRVHHELARIAGFDSDARRQLEGR